MLALPSLSQASLSVVQSLWISICGHQAASHNLVVVFNFMLPVSAVARVFLLPVGMASVHHPVLA